MTSQYQLLSNALADNATLELQSTGENLDAIVGLLPLSGVARVLDVGCGSGALTRAIARRLSPDVEVWGLDVSPAHVDYAARAAKNEGLENLRYLAGDIFTALPELPGSLDLICEKYVLMSMVAPSDSQRFFSSTKRLLRPGGVLALIEADINFGQDRYPPPPEPLWLVLPQIVKFYRDLGSIEWRCGIRLHEYLTQAGFADVQVKLADGRIMRGGMPESLIDHACTDVEQLLQPCLEAMGKPHWLPLVARQWREYLRDQRSFVYNPIFVGTGVATRQ